MSVGFVDICRDYLINRHSNPSVAGLKLYHGQSILLFKPCVVVLTLFITKSHAQKAFYDVLLDGGSF